jgi:hypothetical protein
MGAHLTHSIRAYPSRLAHEIRIISFTCEIGENCRNIELEQKQRIIHRLCVLVYIHWLKFRSKGVSDSSQ